jgi:hypothetical protein
MLSSYKEGYSAVASLKDDPIGDWFDKEDHLLVRARMVRKASILWAPPHRDWPVLHSVLIKAPKHAGDRWLVVFKADTDEGPRVAFFKGGSLMGALGNGLSAVFGGRIEWKLETPYRPERG